MPLYICPKDGRKVEKPEGSYVCKVCGSRMVISPKTRAELIEEKRREARRFAAEWLAKGFRRAIVEDLPFGAQVKTEFGVTQFIDPEGPPESGPPPIGRQWKVISKKVGEAVIASDDWRALLIYETDPARRRESGWYVLRVWNARTMYWVDHARPGYGVTYWVKADVARDLGLETSSPTESQSPAEFEVIALEDDKVIERKTVPSPKEAVEIAERILKERPTSWYKIVPKGFRSYYYEFTVDGVAKEMRIWAQDEASALEKAIRRLERVRPEAVPTLRLLRVEI